MPSGAIHTGIGTPHTATLSASSASVIQAKLGFRHGARASRRIAAPHPLE